MGRTAKIVLGVATVWPITFVTWFLVVGMPLWRHASGEGLRPLPSPLSDLLPLLFRGTGLLVLLLTAGYCLDALINRRLELRQRVLWVILLGIGNFITLPIYFALGVWPEGGEAGEGLRGDRRTPRCGARRLLGLATFWPMGLFVLVFVLAIVAAIVLGLAGQESIRLSGPLGLIVFELFALTIRGTILLLVALTLFYVLHALHNEELDEDDGLIWSIFLVAFNALSMPIYFLRYVRRGASAAGSGARPDPGPPPPSQRPG